MIAKLFLTVTLAVALLTGGSPCKSAAHDTDAGISEQIMTHAISYDGEVIPRIDLPVVEIKASLNTKKIVGAYLVDGHVYPQILLDEVIITPDV